jgi:hypothetical protein
MSSITTLRPDGTYSSGLWGVTGAGSIDAALSDDSDATYATCPATVPNNVMLLGLDDVGSTPAGEYIARARIRVRAARTTSTSSDNLVIWLVTSTNEFVAGMDVMIEDTTPADYTGGWFYETNGSGAFGESQVNDWRLRPYVRRGPDGEDMEIIVYEMYVDVEYNELPTVTYHTPVGTVPNTNKPTIHITADDPEGDLITGYSVLVQDGDDVSPGIGTIHWESGEVVVADASDVYIDIETGLDLRAGAPGYKVFAQVFQDMPDGGRLRSDWVEGGDFYINLAEVPPPQVIVDEDYDANGVPIYQQTAISRLNILDYASSTLDSGLSVWAADADSVVAHVTDAGEGHDGDDYYFTLTRDLTTGVAEAQNAGTLLLPLEPGEAVDGSAIVVNCGAYLKAETTGRNCRIILSCYDDALASTGTITGAWTADTAGSWTLITCSGDIPADTVGAIVRIQVDACPAGELHRVDDIVVHPGGPLYFNVGGRAASGFGVAGPRLYLRARDAQSGNLLAPDEYVRIDQTDGYSYSIDDYDFIIGEVKQYITWMETWEGLEASTRVTTFVGPHDPEPSGWWMRPKNKAAFAVSLIGPALETTHWQDSADYVPLGREDTITISDGGKLPARSFKIEVTSNTHAEAIRRIFYDSGGRFTLIGTWPFIETAIYQVTGGSLREQAENTDPSLFTFLLDAQMIERVEV